MKGSAVKATSPRVSVVIPCRNYARYVGLAVESILAQSLAPDQLEVIVIDDGSTDDSWATIERYTADRRVRAIKHEANRGHVATLEHGFALARGEYVVVVDADDHATSPDALRLTTEVLDAEPSIGFVFCDHEVIDGDGRHLRFRRPRFPGVIPGPRMFRDLLLENVVVHTGTMVRARCFREVGGHDARFHVGEDWELWLRLASRYDVGHVPRVLYAWRQHPDSLQAAVDADHAIPGMLMVIERALEYTPQAERATLRVRAVASVHLLRAHVYAVQGRRTDAWRDLLAAARMEPRILCHRRAAKTVARILLRRLSTVGS